MIKLSENASGITVKRGEIIYIISTKQTQKRCQHKLILRNQLTSIGNFKGEIGVEGYTVI